MSKHTPGPWMVAKDNPRKVVSHSIDGLDPLTGENLVGGASEGPYAAANARLFALALEMKEAIKTYLENEDSGLERGDYKQALHNAHRAFRAILAKLETA